MAGERMEWNIEDCMQIARDLNQKGTLIKNAIAGIYNMFRYQVSEYWSGKNYNKVIGVVNEMADSCRRMTVILGDGIPNSIAEIVQAQATDGQGSVSNGFSLSSDDNNPDIWEIQESPENVNIKITLDVVKQYFQSENDPSVLYRANLAKQYLSEYVNTFENAMPLFNNNQGITDMYNNAVNYKVKFEAWVDETMETIIDAANQEISGIEEINLKTKEQATSATQGANPSTGSGDTLTPPISAGEAVAATTGNSQFVAASTMAGVVAGAKKHNEYVEKSTELQEKIEDVREKETEAKERWTDAQEKPQGAFDLFGVKHDKEAREAATEWQELGRERIGLEKELEDLKNEYGED